MSPSSNISVRVPPANYKNMMNDGCAVHSGSALCFLFGPLNQNLFIVHGLLFLAYPIQMINMTET